MSNFNLAKVYYNLITGSQKESLVKQPMRRHPHKTLPGKYEGKKKRKKKDDFLLAITFLE